MRRLISFILLIAVFWGGWQLFLYQAGRRKRPSLPSAQRCRSAAQTPKPDWLGRTRLIWR